MSASTSTRRRFSICVVSQARKVLDRKRFYCSDPGRIVAFFEALRPFQAVVEATASYEWLFKLAEPLSEQVAPAHPKKLRVIAESTRNREGAGRLDRGASVGFSKRLSLHLGLGKCAGEGTPYLAGHRPRWDRSTEADGEGGCAETSPQHFSHQTLDKHCFIEGDGWATASALHATVRPPSRFDSLPCRQPKRDGAPAASCQWHPPIKLYQYRGIRARRQCWHRCDGK